MAKRTQEERNSGFYAETAERMGRSDRTAFKERDSLKAFHYAYEKSPGYKKCLEGRGVDPGAVKNIDDFSKLPVLKKNMMPERHQNDPPFGGFLAVPVEKLKRIYVSPGPIYDPEGRKEDYWGLRKCLYNAGFRPGDIVMNTFSYHLPPAASFLHDTAKGLSMEIALVAGEILSPSLRKGLNDYGIIVRQAYITAELGGVAYECPQENGMHISDDLYIEICAPVTGAPLPAGSIGEVVVTDFSNECYPLVRYGTGDLSAVDEGECLCGRASYKMKGIRGRGGGGTKIKGMFVHPRQIDEAAAAFHEEVE